MPQATELRSDDRSRRGRAGPGRLLDLSPVQDLLQLAYSLPLWFVLRPRRLFDPAAFPETRALLDAAAELVDECERFVEDGTHLASIQSADPTQRRLNRDQRWLVTLLRLYGTEVPVTRAEMPVTAAFLDAHPDVVTAMVSVLEPGKRIAPHPGPMKGVLRVHLGVQAPSSGRCELVLAGRRCTWRRGSVMVFDDTYPHWVVNRTDERRVVLFLDLVRPMPWPWLDRLNRRFIGWLGTRQRVDVIVERARLLAAERAAAVGARP